MRSLYISVFLLTGCQAGDASETTYTAAVTGCTDTSVALQVRAFIPNVQCGRSDGPDDSQCSGGFPQPPAPSDIGVCYAQYHGDLRSFSTAWDASHRVRAIVNVPTMRGDTCPGSASRSVDSSDSHRCACYGSIDPQDSQLICTFPTCLSQSATPATSVSQDGTSCSSNSLDTFYQVHTHDALVFIPGTFIDAYDKVEIHSSGSGAPNWTLFGSAQQYTVDVWHTPFPSQELLVSYACGTKVASLYQYTTPDCGPSLSNLGDSHALDVHRQVKFSIIYDPKTGVSLGPAGGQPPPVCGVLPSGQQLLAGESLWSCDGRFHLAMQSDGNLVLYQANGPIWATGTNGRGGVKARMQTDGNLVVYTSGGTAIWASNTNGHSGAYAAVQNDGNFVVYSSGGTALWASGTVPCNCYSGNGAYCGSMAIQHSQTSHCSLPFTFTSGFLYNCANGSWSLQQRCTNGQCTFNPNGADFCSSSCAGPVCGSNGTCCPAGDWCGTSGQCCHGCGAGCPC